MDEWQAWRADYLRYLVGKLVGRIWRPLLVIWFIFAAVALIDVAL